MRQIITVSFDNTIFQLDEEAHGALRRYLERARAGLAGNPDLLEILEDLERSIFEKVSAVLKAGKPVLYSEEMNRILDNIGPVVEASGATPAAPPAGTFESGTRSPRKLYRQTAGAKLSGVCSGLAEYFGVDVVFVRIGFVAATFLWGIGIVAYLVMEALMPSRAGQDRRQSVVLKLVLLAVLLTIPIWLDVDRGRFFGMGVVETLTIISVAILVYAAPFAIAAGLVVLAFAAVKYLRSGPQAGH